jgi:N6-L-threonylcarbamoyladenine synthase
VLTVRQSDPSVKFPFLVLLVSGGHCQLLVAVAVGEYKMLGGTLDDSLGEAYDKSARMLGLDVGGGGGQVLARFDERRCRG